MSMSDTEKLIEVLREDPVLKGNEAITEPILRNLAMFLTGQDITSGEIVGRIKLVYPFEYIDAAKQYAILETKHDPSTLIFRAGHVVVAIIRQDWGDFERN